MPRIPRTLLSSKGYTLDQTILIVAIIAILITLVIAAVGWQLINRAGGTKAGSQLQQVKDANGRFFSDQHIWPHQALATGNSPSTAVLVLTGTTNAAWSPNIDPSRLTNLITGLTISNTRVMHGFGKGGVITQTPNRYPGSANIGTDLRMVIQFAGVPVGDADEADRAVDTTPDNTSGRVIYTDFPCLAPTNGVTSVPDIKTTLPAVYICYAANDLD